MLPSTGPPIIGAGLLIAVLVGGPLYLVARYGVGRVHRLVRQAGRDAGGWLVTRVTGGRGSAASSAFVATAVIALTIASLGLLWSLTSDLNTSGSSAPLIELLLGFLTSGWGYLLVALVVGRGSLFFLRQTLIRIAARTSGYSYQTIARLAAEAKTTDGCTRIIAQPEDTVETVAQHIKWGFKGRDEQIRRSDTDTKSTDTASTTSTEPEHRVRLTIDQEPVPEWFAGLAGITPTTPEYPDWFDALAGPYPDTAPDRDHDDPVLLEEQLQTTVDEERGVRIEERTVTPQDGDLTSPLASQTIDETPLDSLNTDEREEGDGAASGALDWFSAATATDWTDPKEDDDDEGLSWRARFKLFRLDFANSFHANRVIWRFLVPAGLAFGAMLIVARIWVHPLLYLLFGTAALGIGALVYGVTKYRMFQRLNALRTTETTASFSLASVLVKRVDTPDRTMYYGFVAGRVYASPDPDRLATVLAERAHDRINGHQPAPAIEERWAWCLKRYIPSLEAWQENIEKPAILDRLTDTVYDAPKHLIAKDTLADTVVEADRHWKYTTIPFVPAQYAGFGHDPQLVADVYQDLVPAGLVEDTVPVTNPDGDDRAVTVVRPRISPLPEHTERLEAQFASRFRARNTDTRYSLPEATGTDEAPRFVAPTSASTVTLDEQPATPVPAGLLHPTDTQPSEQHESA
jgi:hypothetical protein